MCMQSGLYCGWLQTAMYLVYWVWGMVCLPVCRNCGVHEQCWVCIVCMVYCLYGMLEFKLCCRILLLLRYGLVESYGVSNAEYLLHLVRMNRVCAYGEFCGVHSQLGWHKM